LADTSSTWVWRVRGKHGANYEHHRGHPEATSNQTLLAAKAINSQEKEKCGGNDLDSAVNTSGEK